MLLKDLNVPDKYLSAIGRVAVEWNRLEAVLELCLTRMLRMEPGDKRIVILFAHMPINQRLEVLMTLLSEESKRMGNTVFLNEYKKLVHPKIEELKTKRNMIIHSRWHVRGREVRVTSFKAHGKLQASQKVAFLKDVENVSAEIQTLANTLFLISAGQEVPKT